MYTHQARGRRRAAAKVVCGVVLSALDAGAISRVTQTLDIDDLLYMCRLAESGALCKLLDP